MRIISTLDTNDFPGLAQFSSTGNERWSLTLICTNKKSRKWVNCELLDVVNSNSELIMGQEYRHWKIISEENRTKGSCLQNVILVTIK
jgi:hypothetical protein